MIGAKIQLSYIGMSSDVYIGGIITGRVCYNRAKPSRLHGFDIYIALVNDVMALQVETHLKFEGAAPEGKEFLLGPL